MTKPKTQFPASPVTIDQAAAYLQCNAITIRRMISRGELRAYRYSARIIRIDMADLEKLRRPVTSAADLGGDVA